MDDLGRLSHFLTILFTVDCSCLSVSLGYHQLPSRSKAMGLGSASESDTCTPH